jgi:hypothetical protein
MQLLLQTIVKKVCLRGFKIEKQLPLQEDNEIKFYSLGVQKFVFSIFGCPMFIF